MARHGKTWHDMAWHDPTQKELPPTLEKYDQTARNLSEAIMAAQDNRGDKSLWWAADGTLLDILIDECVKQKITRKSYVSMKFL